MSITILLVYRERYPVEYPNVIFDLLPSLTFDADRFACLIPRTESATFIGTPEVYRFYQDSAGAFIKYKCIYNDESPFSSDCRRSDGILIVVCIFIYGFFLYVYTPKRTAVLLSPLLSPVAVVGPSADGRAPFNRSIYITALIDEILNLIRP